MDNVSNTLFTFAKGLSALGTDVPSHHTFHRPRSPSPILPQQSQGRACNDIFAPDVDIIDQFTRNTS
jgi:hypothetical protein